MLKTCFGCCPLRHGVSAIALINMIWNILELIVQSSKRYDQYNRYTLAYYEKINSTDDYSDPRMNDDYYFQKSYKLSALTGIFMDYILILRAGWITLEIISNINLKQSTFKQAPQKIYVWLTVYYANLLFMTIHSIHSVLIIIKHQNVITSIPLPLTVDSYFGKFYANLLYIVIVLFEITIVHSYYILEHNAILNTFVQLKWKYISNGKVESQGVDLTSTSAFMASTSRQTEEGTKLPPYITNVLQN